MICLLHFNELPFQHLFEFYFGKTTGPRTFGGEFGKKITKDLMKLKIVDYSPISGCNIENFPEQMICERSNDQKYLYNIAKAIKNDPKCFPTYLVDLNPGTIHHARWLTRANKILQLYVSTLNPSFEFLRIVHHECVYSILVLFQTASILFSRRIKFVPFHISNANSLK